MCGANLRKRRDKMKVNDLLHGFRVTGIRHLAEIDADMVEMVYEKNGAGLIWLDRKDTNKTFAVTFKTIPDDSTGVFHIIEHSVLCGSDKYPIKDPFVELLKSSLQTFLNAMTFPDKTMYPVSSRNDKDFLNLVDIYMDAVLHPQILTKPEIFYQEGWHYDWTDKDSEPTFKGVVFNEMKGAYSSVDDLVEEEMKKLMYPDVCYGKDSGGNPVHIPDLTYEKFVACHRKYYHPSNSRIFLDGEMNIAEVLAKLDSFLSAYDRLDIDTTVPMQAPKGERVAEAEYELAENEDPEGKTRLVLGYMGFPYDDQKDSLALSVLTRVLCGSNESPLKAELLSEGLCQDVSIPQYDSIQQSSVLVDVQNVKEENIPKIRAVIRDVFEKAASGGLEPARMTAALNSMEFRLRERDFGRTPRGLVYAISSMESWLYGGDPAQNLCYDASLAFLRENLSTGYFENLLRRVFLENPHTAVLTMRPSKTLADRRLADEKDRLSKAKASWSEEKKEEILALNRRLLAWQQTDDTAENLATLPQLSLSDISDKPEKLPLREEKTDGVTVLHHDVPTGGILYTDMLFNIADATADDVKLLSLLCNLFTRTATEKHDALSLQDEISTWLGYLSMTVQTYHAEGKEDGKVYLSVSAGVLEKNRDKLPELLSEVLFTSLFNNKEQILNILRQMKMDAENYIVGGGHMLSLYRTQAGLVGYGAAVEYFRGYENYLWVKDTEKNFDKKTDALCVSLAAALRRYITKDRLILSVTGEADDAYLSKLIGLLPSDGITPAVYTALRPLGAHKEGIRIPSQISFAVRAGKAPVYTGTMGVAENLVSYEYLWNRIRVQGGAYGAGLVTRKNGMLFCYSYRDPNPKNSLSVYEGVPAFLREFCKGGVSVEKYIIGAVGSSEPLMSPRALGDAATVEYMCEVTYEDVCRVRREMLATDTAALVALADTMERAYAAGGICVVGGKDKLADCEDVLDTVVDM